MSKRLIVSADDFGLSPEINEAVERAHRDGILRAASLMVNAPATPDAVERARRLPNLAVGLHVVLVHGRPALPVERVPDLVDSRGEFPTDLVRAGFRFFFTQGCGGSSKPKSARSSNASPRPGSYSITSTRNATCTCTQPSST